MCECRANCSVIVPEGDRHLYAFGGYNNNNYNSSAVTSTIERICLDNIESRQWQVVPLQLNTDPKACNYMYQLSPTEILVFGGWQNGQTSRHIDCWNPVEMTYNSWKNEEGRTELKEADMITKPILKLNESVIAIQGRKFLHFIDVKRRQCFYLSASGEDQAEQESIQFNKLVKEFED